VGRRIRLRDGRRRSRVEGREGGREGVCIGGAGWEEGGREEGRAKYFPIGKERETISHLSLTRVVSKKRKNEREKHKIS